MKDLRTDHASHGTDRDSAGPAPGKRTRSEDLAPAGAADAVQFKAAAALSAAASGYEDPFGMHLIGGPVQMRGGTAAAGDVHAAAEHGIAGGSGVLPFLDQIQASFGQHDVSGIQAHVGGAAAEASAAMGAQAYATGDHVAFAGGPDLHTAAHEAAHVVQQRDGVSLKGGVGEAGDSYERNADLVADAVVRGESAADLLGAGGGAPGIQRVVQRDEQQQGGGGATASAVVDVTVNWTSPFGNKVTGTVTLSGRNGTSGNWTAIDTQQVAAANTATFAGAQRYSYYKALIKPVDDVAGDADHVGQFKETDLFSSAAVGVGVSQATVSGGLELNRWNHDNVEKRHQQKGLDPDKTNESNTVRKPLFGRSVRVHNLVAGRVEQTNALFEALPERERAEIYESIFVMGAFAYRNQVGKKGSFSDHSVGMAIDVNYNEGKKQNALMETASEKSLLKNLVQPVVRTDPGHADFDIWTAQGQEQLKASKVFNARFPAFLADLLDRDDDVAAMSAADQFVNNTLTQPSMFASVVLAHLVRENQVRAIMTTVSAADLAAAIASQSNATKKKQLQLIADNWESLSAWVLGTTVTDEHSGEKDASGHSLPDEQKRAVGMIPIDSRVLQMFLDTGWEWGGDWGAGTGRKDYMHFQDNSHMDEIQLEDE